MKFAYPRNLHRSKTENEPGKVVNYDKCDRLAGALLPPPGKDKKISIPIIESCGEVGSNILTQRQRMDSHRNSIWNSSVRL